MRISDWSSDVCSSDLTVLIIVVCKSIAAYAIVRLFAHPHRTALTVAASLAQIGEFSFILAGLGVGLGVMPEDGRDLILAGAILRSEEHTSELQSLMRISYAVFCLKKKKQQPTTPNPAPPSPHSTPTQ